MNSFKSQSYKFQEQQDIPYNFQPGQAMPNRKNAGRSYDMELRVFLIINGFVSIVDFCVVFLTIPSILMSTRILYTYYWRDQGGHLNQMRKLLFLNLGLAFFDLVNIFPLIFDILTPTRYVQIIRAIDLETRRRESNNYNTTTKPTLYRTVEYTFEQVFACTNTPFITLTNEPKNSIDEGTNIPSMVLEMKSLFVYIMVGYWYLNELNKYITKSTN